MLLQHGVYAKLPAICAKLTVGSMCVHWADTEALQRDQGILVNEWKALGT